MDSEEQEVKKQQKKQQEYEEKQAAIEEEKNEEQDLSAYNQETNSDPITDEDDENLDYGNGDYSNKSNSKKDQQDDSELVERIKDEVKKKAREELGNNKAGEEVGKGAAKNATKQAAKSTAKKEAGKQVAMEGAKATQAAASSSGAAAGATGVGGIAAALGPIIFWIAVILIIIIFVVGILFFFITMPGSVVGKIDDWISENIIKKFDGFVNGDHYAEIMVDKKAVTEAGDYVKKMGYDLKGFGFLDSEVKDKVSAVPSGDSISKWFAKFDETESRSLGYTDFQKTSAKDRKKANEAGDYHDLYLSEPYVPNNDGENNANILMALDGNGEIVYVKSKYLAMYLTADNATYLVRNYNQNIVGRVKKILGLPLDKGSGLISFVLPQDSSKPSDYVRNFDNNAKFKNPETFLLKRDKVLVSRPYRSMRIDNADDGIGIKTWYDYGLEGWVSSYGIPLQFSLALHIASLAPDFAFKVAQIAAEETEVRMGLIETKNNQIKMALNIDMDGDSNSEKYYVETKYMGAWHKDVSGKIETPDTIDKSLEKFPDVDDSKVNVPKLDEYEKELDTITNNGKNKISFGNFGYIVYDDYYKNSTKPEDNGKNLDGSLAEDQMFLNVNKEDENVKKFVNVLVHNKYIEYDKKDKRYKGLDQAKTDEAKKVFKKYFTIMPLEDVLKLDPQKDYPNNTYVENFYKYYKKEGSRIYKVKSDNAVKVEDRCIVFHINDNKNGYVKTVLQLYDIDTIWDWYFLGKYTFSTRPTYDLSNYSPVRKYYRLVKASNGKPVKYFKDLKRDEKGNVKADQFIFVHGASTYYEDKKDEGWFWGKAIPVKIAKVLTDKMEMESGTEDSNESVFNILSKAAEVNVDDFTRYIPIILEVKNHWFQDLSFKDCYEWDTSIGGQESINNYIPDPQDGQAIKTAAENDILYTVETSNGTVAQRSEPKATTKPGEKINKLIKGKKYDKYDGRGKLEKPSKIDFKKSVIDGNVISMLEQIQGEDSEILIAKFKELMAQYGVEFEETSATADKKSLFSKVIKDYDSDGKLLLVEGDDCVYRASLPPAQNGFEPDMYVQSPCSGSISYVSDDSVCIEIDNFNGGMKGYSILISGFKVEGNISSGSAVAPNTFLGRTLRQDLKLVLRDDKGAIIRNEYTVTSK